VPHINAARNTHKRHICALITQSLKQSAEIDSAREIELRRQITERNSLFPAIREGMCGVFVPLKSHPAITPEFGLSRAALFGGCLCIRTQQIRQVSFLARQMLFE
jgi:hypothetical protein